MTALLQWDSFVTGNPFDPTFSGLRLVQQGGDALLEWNPFAGTDSSPTWRTLVRLQQVQASTLTFHNFVGNLVPDGGAVPGETWAGQRATTGAGAPTETTRSTVPTVPTPSSASRATTR